MTKVSNPLISVIVPIYKVEEYLDKCVDSIVNQTYTNLEIILVNDGSPDNCPKMCDEWSKKDSRIKVIHKENGGVSSARNKGLEIATGEWISFIDSDDWVEKDYIYELYNAATSNNAQISLCSYNRVVGNKIEQIMHKARVVSGNEYLISTLNPQTGFGFCHMKLYSASCIKDIKFNTSLKIGEDALYNEQVSKNINRAIIINKCLYNYRINSNSVVKRFDKDYVNKFLDSMILNKEYILNNYKDKNVIQSLYNYIAFHVMLIAVNYCFNSKNEEKNKIRLLSKICNINIFKESIKKSNYSNLSFTRKITLFTLKYKLYFITKVICIIRQRQNKGDV